MAQKKEVKVRDLKPSKDAKGGAARNQNASMNRSANRATNNSANRSTNRSSMAGRTNQ